MTVKISAQNLCKSFNGKQTLFNVNLNINEGETTVVIGCSGSGKSVLLRTIIGLLQPDSGRVLIDNVNINGAHHKQIQKIIRGLGVCFQGNALFDSMTIKKNMAFALQNSNRGKLSPEEIHNIVVEYLEKVDLKPSILNLYPSELSGGMQKRIALARALINDPNIIVLDEPTTGLDPINSSNIMDMVSKLCKHGGKTTIIISHDINAAYQIADKIAVMLYGKLIWYGPKANIFSCKDEYVQELIRFINT